MSQKPREQASLLGVARVSSSLEGVGTGEPHLAGRSARVSAKLRVARQLLEDLSQSDPRRRLLELAMVRQDEVLLDGLLARLQEPIGGSAAGLSAASRARAKRP